MTATEDLAIRLEQVRREVTAAAVAAGRDPAQVCLVAVSKTVGVEVVRQACAAGQCHFGENRVQELVTKAAGLPASCVWHLIGHLQGNKVRAAVQAAAWIHSVDSLALLERLERVASAEGRRPTVLLQVNISEEASKSGVPEAEVDRLLERALACSHLACRGLMGMAPFGATDAELHRVFGALRRCRERLEAAFGVSLPELSMGMSGDFRIAIAEGATLVRVGTAIFGARPPTA